MDWFLNWLPKIFLWSAFFFTFAIFFQNSRKRKSFMGFSYRRLIFAVLLFYIFYASLLTVLQYYTWSQNDFTKILLTLPADREALQPILKNLFLLFDHKLGYFFLYVWGRFWLEAFLSILVAGFFYLFLQALSLAKKEFFKPGEKELGFLGALLVGWPNVVLFVPLVFFLTLGISVVRRFFFKEYGTTIGVPFVAAAFLILLFGNTLIALLHFTTLRV